MRLLGEVFLARHPSPFEAYLALERRLIDHWVTLRRGIPAEFVDRYAGAYRRRYGWMLKGDRTTCRRHAA